MKRSEIKIIAPLSSVEEARMLPALGADEMYFSFQPKNAVSAISRRELRRANFSSMEDVGLAIQIAKKRRAKMFLALNKAYYTNDELPKVKKIAEECIEAGIDGVIAADQGLMELFAREKINERIEIILSAVASVQNTAAVKYFSRFGISRVILPRHIPPEATRKFVESFKNIVFEVFVLNWHCINIDGICRFQHDIPDANKHPALTRNGCCLEYCVDDTENGSRISESFRGLYERSASACAVCSMHDFKEAGIRHFKIVGRLTETRDKLISVEFVNACRDLLSGAQDFDKYVTLARRLYENYYGSVCSGTCWHGYRGVSVNIDE